MSPVPTLLIAPSELERAIERLPAGQRARLRWAPERFRRILDRLLVGDVTPEVLHEVTAEFVRVCVPLFRDVLSRPGLHDDLSRNIPELGQSLHRLSTWFQQSSAVAGIEWTVRVLENLWALFPSSVSTEETVAFVGSLDESRIEEEVRNPVMGFLKAQVILFALLQAADRDLPPGGLESLAETAYLEVAQGVDLMAIHGIELDPWSRLTPEQRFQKTQQAIQDVFEAMTPRAVDIISRAHVSSL